MNEYYEFSELGVVELSLVRILLVFNLNFDDKFVLCFIFWDFVARKKVEIISSSTQKEEEEVEAHKSVR